MKKKISFTRLSFLKKNLGGPKLVSLIFAVLVVCFAIAFYALGWVEPGESPPGVTVYAPLNVSGEGQAKSGGLMLGAGVPEPNSSALIVLGEATDPVGGVCPAGYDWYDMNNDGFIDNDECRRTVLHTESTGGKVGIGTTEPTQKLDIVGNLRIQDHYGIRIEDTLLKYIWRIVDDTDTPLSNVGVFWNSMSDAILFNNYEGRIWFRTGSGGTVASSYLVIDSDGDVGIGTSIPATRLEVKGGKIKATGGLIIETRADDPEVPDTGQIWLITE